MNQSSKIPYLYGFHLLALAAKMIYLLEIRSCLSPHYLNVLFVLLNWNMTKSFFISLGINTIMAGLRPTHKTNPCVSFALKLRSAWSLSNYYRFFKLLCPANDDQQPPLRCKHVVNWFVDRERKEAIRLMFKVYVVL